MEGMPRLPMLNPDFRAPTAAVVPEFSEKIKEYIVTHYQDDPTKYDAGLKELETLRERLTYLAADIETVCIVKRYYAQLRMMKSRFPMEAGDPIRIPFAWIEKGADMTNTNVYEDVNFELASVMFNIGAIHAAIAAQETRSDADSIKNAFTHFQCAAHPFQYIRDKMNATRYSAVDFDTGILTWYVNLLLAQAQECILEKSLIDHRKNSIVAKIATYLRDVYRQCGDHLEKSCAQDVISSSKYKGWLRMCDVKSELYGAIAMSFMGDQAEADQKMGARLAYYEMAQKSINLAMKYVEKDKRESLRQAVNFVNDVVVAKCTNAKKENDFVYNDRIPKFEELPEVEPVAMVKPIGFDPTDRSVSGDDLFATLLPMNVIRAVSVYSEEKAKCRRDVLERVEAKNHELGAYLASLRLSEINLDASVDDLRLPDSLLEKSAAFNSQPDAFPELLEKLKKVGDCAMEADGKLRNLSHRLAAIDLPELTTDEGFLAISRELSKVNEHHKKARENNTELQKAIAAHSENLRILAMPLNELNRHISGPVIKPSETAEGAQLKKMLEKAEEMGKQRQQLVSGLTRDLDTDDITSKCLAEKDFDNEELYKKELTKHDKTIKLIDMNLGAQVNVLNALTEANASFAECRKQVMELNNSRNDQVLALVAAYEVYCDVLQKAEEGLQFYSTLFTLVRTLGQAIEGIEEAYSTEKAKKDKEKAEAEELARKAKMAREAREAMKQFSSDAPATPPTVNGALGGASTPSIPFQPGAGNRFDHFLAYYRNKLAGQVASSPLARNVSTPPEQVMFPASSEFPSSGPHGHRSSPFSSPLPVSQQHGFMPTSGGVPFSPGVKAMPQYPSQTHMIGYNNVEHFPPFLPQASGLSPNAQRLEPLPSAANYPSGMPLQGHLRASSATAGAQPSESVLPSTQYSEQSFHRFQSTTPAEVHSPAFVRAQHGYSTVPQLQQVQQIPQVCPSGVPQASNSPGVPFVFPSASNMLPHHCAFVSPPAHSPSVPYVQPGTSHGYSASVPSVPSVPAPSPTVTPQQQWSGATIADSSIPFGAPVQPQQNSSQNPISVVQHQQQFTQAGAISAQLPGTPLQQSRFHAPQVGSPILSMTPQQHFSSNQLPSVTGQSNTPGIIATPQPTFYGPSTMGAQPPSVVPQPHQVSAAQVAFAVPQQQQPAHGSSAAHQLSQFSGFAPGGGLQTAASNFHQQQQVHGASLVPQAGLFGVRLPGSDSQTTSSKLQPQVQGTLTSAPPQPRPIPPQSNAVPATNFHLGPGGEQHQLQGPTASPVVQFTPAMVQHSQLGGGMPAGYGQPVQMAPHPQVHSGTITTTNPYLANRLLLQNAPVVNQDGQKEESQKTVPPVTQSPLATTNTSAVSENSQSDKGPSNGSVHEVTLKQYLDFRYTGNESPFVPIKSQTPVTTSAIGPSNATRLSSASLQQPASAAPRFPTGQSFPSVAQSQPNFGYQNGALRPANFPVARANFGPASSLLQNPNVVPFHAGLTSQAGYQMGPSASSQQQVPLVKPEPQKMDLMSSPLDSNLPAPLVPRNTGATSSIGTAPSQSFVPKSSPAAKSASSGISNTSEQMNSVSNTAPVMPSPRPAAAVAPIVQPNVPQLSNGAPVLGLTPVTSLSYAPSVVHKIPEVKGSLTTAPSLTDSRNGLSELITDKSELKSVTKTSTEEQCGVEGQMQTPSNGVEDPLSQLDAYFWMKK